MRKKTNASVMALCGVLAALAMVMMFLSGVLPFASIACPVLASLILVPVYTECGAKWGILWYAAVAILSILIAPSKESAILFVFFGYYPLIKKRLGRLPFRYVWKLLYLNIAVLLAYGLMLYVFKLNEVAADFAEIQKWMLAVMLLLANVSFLIYDVLINRIELQYLVRLRPKLKF